MRMSPILALLCCLGSGAASATLQEAEGFELILLDGFEDCPLAYRDLDLDTWGGDSDVRIVCGPPPAGYVATGGDCDDANAQINPAASEPEPDAQFLDENCDGVDGNAALAIFVAQPGSVAADCGTRALPCALSVAAFRAQSTGRTQAYLQQGNYPIALRLETPGANLALFGGYDAQWRRANRNTNPSRILGGPVALVGGVGVQAAGGNYRLVDLLVEAPSTSQRNGSGDGLGSYGVRAIDSTSVTLLRVTISAGNGANGLSGGDGTSATQAPAQAGATGGDGAELNVACNNTTRGLGGPAGINASCVSGTRPTNGGNGGSGGTMDTGCDVFDLDLDARPGINGSSAAFTTVTNGLGGAGGSGTNSCGPTTGGSAGLTVHGVGGSASGVSARGALVLVPLASSWVADAGNSGSLGLDGSGGGGGGGAGGCDVGTDSYGAGGGGGGAGGCRAPATGSGGRGGGGSFGVFAVNATIAVQNSTLVRGTGGSGGPGGDGGLGQPGGGAGQVGLHPGGAIAGLGGAGGDGGNSGAGGGGAGGISTGIFAFQATISANAGNAFSGGAGGAGGTGGVGGTVGASGANGPAGTLASTFTCAAAAGC